MVCACCVPGCSSRGRGIRYFRVPFTNKPRLEAWLASCPFLKRYKYIQLENVRFCYLHFNQEQISSNNRLSADAVPTLNLPASSGPDTSTTELPKKSELCITVGPILPGKDLDIEVNPSTADNSTVLNESHIDTSVGDENENSVDLDVADVDVDESELTDDKSNSLLACRICLACDVKLYNIRELKLDQMYVETMGTTLSEWDGLPQHVCSFCRALLMKSHELRTRCHRAEALLKQALMLQPLITTNDIRSIDRKAHKLTHKLSSICSNATVKVFTHQEEQTDTLLKAEILNSENDTLKVEVGTLNDEGDALHEEDDYIVLSEENFNDLKEFLLFSERSGKCEIRPVSNSEFDDAKINEIDMELEETYNIADDELVGVTETAKIIPKFKRKRVDEKENVPQPKRKKTEETEEGPKPLEDKSNVLKRRWKKKNKIPFGTEENLRSFEEKYNFKVIELTDEEMLEEMEAKRRSENYICSAEKCELCFKGFLSAETYNNHMKIHDPARPYECHLCKRRFFTSSNHRYHIQIMHRLKFLCLICKERFTTKPSAEFHAAFHAGTTFKCKHCDLQFLKISSRSTHTRLAHPIENADAGTCDICGEVLMNELGLRFHKARRHEQSLLPRLRCKKCKVRFKSIEAVERHRIDQPSGTCDPNLSYCAQCGATFSNDDDVTQHRVSEHGLQLFTCDTCSKTFISKESLSTHIDRVHLCIRKPRPVRTPRVLEPGYTRPRRKFRVVCECCGKRLECMATLKVHMNMHTGERPFKCNLCPKSYFSRAGLRFHNFFHAKEHKFQCPECPATFRYPTSVSKHMPVHRHDRPYRCECCKKSYKTKSALYSHIRYIHMRIIPPSRNRP